MEKITRKYLQEPEQVKSYTDEQGREIFTFIISTNKIDRHGEIVNILGIDFSNYIKNPVVLAQHDSDDLPIALCTKLYYNFDSSALLADLYFTDETEDSIEYHQAVKSGTIRACSIGFRGNEYTQRSPTEQEKLMLPNWCNSVTTIEKSELCEFSIVTIPANPDALRIKELSLKQGAMLNSKNVNKLLMVKDLIDSILQDAGILEPEPVMNSPDMPVMTEVNSYKFDLEYYNKLIGG